MLSATNTPINISALEQSLSELRDAINYNLDNISSLQARLSIVLEPFDSVPSCPGDKPEPPVPSAKVLAELNEQKQLVWRSSRTIEELLRRLVV